MEWIDVACKGGSARDHESGTPTVDDLLGEMDRLRIAESLVTSVWSDVMGAEHANEQLFEDLGPHKRLHPAPEVLPEGGSVFLDRQADAVQDLIAKGAVSAIARCRKNKFPLARWCAGKMLEALQAARLPLMVVLDTVDPDHLVDALRDFPDLPILLQEVPRVGYNRIAYPILEQFPNAYLVCDTVQFIHHGIEYLVGRQGPDQLVWGTRYPLSEGGSAIAGIMYADISVDDKAAIAAGNIRRLIGEVRRG